MVCHGRVQDAATQGELGVSVQSNYLHYRRVEDVNVRVISGNKVRNFYYPNVRLAQENPVCDLNLGMWQIQWTVRSGAIHLYSADVEVVPPDHPYPPPPPWTGTPPRDNWRTPTQPWEHLFGTGDFEHSTDTQTVWNEETQSYQTVTTHSGYAYGYQTNDMGGGTSAPTDSSSQIHDLHSLFDTTPGASYGPIATGTDAYSTEPPATTTYKKK